MKNIRELLKCKNQPGDIGIEIEIEANNIPKELPAIWRQEEDGSLRGESTEFVLRAPIFEKDLRATLESLKRACDNNGMVVRPTYRAGIHVHINVQKLTPIQLVTFMCSYFMMEEVLLRYCDKTRLGNHFCLRLSDASYLVDRLVAFITEEDFLALNDENLRYASLNVTSLFKYGSIEFRALESTMDMQRIETWAGVLLQLRDYAMTLKSPVELLGNASMLGFEQYAPVILGKYYNEFKPWATNANIKQGIRNIQYAIYARNWNQVNLNIFKLNQNLFAQPT